jgi:hypothetical protein
VMNLLRLLDNHPELLRELTPGHGQEHFPFVQRARQPDA